MNSSHLGLFCFFHNSRWEVKRVVKDSIGQELGLPWGLSGKESACNAGGTGAACSILGSERSPGGGHGNPVQCSCLESPTDRGAWKPAVHRIAQIQTRLKSRGQRGLEACGPRSCLESPTDRGAWKPAVHVLAWRVPRTEGPGSLRSIFLPGESHGQRSLEACGPCSCLESPTDRGAWKPAVHRIAQSQTRLKCLAHHRTGTDT